MLICGSCHPDSCCIILCLCDQVTQNCFCSRRPVALSPQTRCDGRTSRWTRSESRRASDRSSSWSEISSTRSTWWWVCIRLWGQTPAQSTMGAYSRAARVRLRLASLLVYTKHFPCAVFVLAGVFPDCSCVTLKTPVNSGNPSRPVYCTRFLHWGSATLQCVCHSVIETLLLLFWLCF